MKRQTVLAACKRIPQAKFTNNRVVPLVCKHSAVGLIEVCKVKPEDPVDYIAEYLFKNNPQEEESFA
jgi:adenylate kinase